MIERSHSSARGPLVLSLLTGALLSTTVAAPARGQAKALTLAEVIGLRQQGVSTRQILRNAKTYCIAFAIDDSASRALSGAGADTALVHGLSDVCSTEHARPRPLLTLIDDEFAHTLAPQAFAWADRQCSSKIEPTGVRIRNRRPDALCMLHYPAGALTGAIRLELTVSEIESERADALSFVFGVAPKSSASFALQVGGDRRLQLCWLHDTECDVLLARAAPEEKAPPTAVYAVEIRGREITVFADGVRVGAYTADRAVAGSLTIGIGPASAARLARLRVLALN